MTKYLKEVELRLSAIERVQPPPQWKGENYIGGGASDLRYLNLKIPLVRREFKKGFSFSNLPTEEQWAIWDYIWQNSRIFEVMLMSSYWAASRPVEELVQHHKVILGWLKHVDNWAHSDELSAHYAKMLELDRRKFLPVFQKWNTSSEPWFKRQSMVGLLFYSRFRRKALPCSTILKFVERHIDDDHYYVQKGVGWTLRECWNLYPTATFTYLKKNAHRVPPGAWTAATEKLSTKDKAMLTSLRRTKRR
ncbi:MAG: DNA alkylation repair protein [Bdellovibrionales bacterium]|nr:DNA alkylation repair protein [Bdellovibrionales bacterium]